MYVISSSYGNDSMALIQWAYENKLDDVTIVFIDTGWSGHKWLDRVREGELFAVNYGFSIVRIKPDMQFRELMLHKKGFPNGVAQWCSGLLKGIPFLNWIESIDPDLKSTVLIGKRRSESIKRANIPEILEESEYHGGRKLWHPLFDHSEIERNDLLSRANFDVLPHRSQECQPCVSLSRKGLRILKEPDIIKTEKLEKEVGNLIFRSGSHGGAIGIREVIKWANYGRGAYIYGQDDLFDEGCGSPFGCGL